MAFPDKIARLIWWRIVKGMREPRGRLLRGLKNLTPEQREARMEVFRKNEKLARRIGPRMLSIAVNGFFIFLAGLTLLNAIQIAQIAGWLPDFQEMRQASR